MYRTEIKVKNASGKIKFTKLRIKLLSAWNAPKDLQKLKDYCIAVLTDRIVFLKDNSFNTYEK